MTMLIRLLALPEPDSLDVGFRVVFPASDETQPFSAPAVLETGDGQTLDLGLLCAPTIFTWREQREMPIATHRYAGSGTYTVRLRWGDVTASATARPGGAIVQEKATGAIPGPELSLFSLRPVEGSPLEVTVRLQVRGMASQQKLRMDGGAGQVHWLSGADGGEQTAEWTLVYPKPSTYTVAMDLMDADNFWLATLTESPVEIVEPLSEPALLQESASDAAVEVRASGEVSSLELAETQVAGLPPWLPFRYVRPVWAWSRTYASPGGGQVSRTLQPGTYLAIKAEAVVGGELWYQSTAGDWIAASAVAIMQPSELRGVELGQALPPVPEPSPPPSVRRGVVTATVLNVRARPGVRPDNPPVDRLREGTEVSIYEESPYEGVPWYRIGENRWVHSGWVRLLTGAQSLAAGPASAGNPGGQLTTLPIGWVVSSVLNVRARPGMASDNPPIDQVHHNQSLPILETRVIGGANWYRIGDDRWVHGGWVGVARFRSRPSAIGPAERWVGVNLKEQTAVAYEGDQPVYAALVATGLPGTPTVQGIFRTWWRVPWRKMSGGRPGMYYYLEEVPWTCYFYKGYALHGAYWHDAFGRPRSHGCVNLSLYDSWWIFQWSEPSGPHSPAVYVYWQ